MILKPIGYTELLKIWSKKQNNGAVAMIVQENDNQDNYRLIITGDDQIQPNVTTNPQYFYDEAMARETYAQLFMRGEIWKKPIVTNQFIDDLVREEIDRDFKDLDGDNELWLGGFSD